MSTWYYAIDGQRYGPVSFEQLQAQADQGHVKALDTVWTEGWADWKPATDVAELRLAPVPLAAVAYHTAAGQMPGRAARALAGYAPPTGDVGDWPLDDVRVAQLVEAGRQRRRVRQAYGLYRGLCVLSAFAAVMVALFLLIPNTIPGVVPAQVAGAAGVMAVFAVLYGLAARTTRRNYVWGGYAIVALLAISSAVSVLGIGVSLLSHAADAGETVGAHVINLLLNAGFFLPALRGLQGSKAFRASPAWCQEVLLRGEVTRRQKDLQ